MSSVIENERSSLLQNVTVHQSFALLEELRSVNFQPRKPRLFSRSMSKDSEAGARRKSESEKEPLTKKADDTKNENRKLIQAETAETGSVCILSCPKCHNFLLDYFKHNND